MFRSILFCCIGFVCFGADSPFKPSEEQKQQIRSKMESLEAAVKAVGSNPLSVDVEVYLKAAEWMLRHEDEFYKPEYVKFTLDGLEQGLTRASELAAGRSSWTKAEGRVPRAYRSRVDGSVQPYIVYVPQGYDGSKPMRLDVVLHGRAAQMTEASFLAGKGLPQRSYLQLEVFGRTNNAYRWAGETDVFEALESVRSHYNVDLQRIVLRGFSMGGAGAWHLGLHYPDRWAAIEAGAGFNETKNYAKLSDLPAHQESVLPIYDSYLWAGNAVNIPVVGYGGDQDPQLQASLNIKEQLGDLFTRALFLVGPNTGHKFHPDSKKESDAFIDESLETPRGDPHRVRFVTYTSRYHRAYWVSIDALAAQYERAEVDARRNGSKFIVITSNIAALTLPRGEVTIDGDQTQGGSLIREAGRWKAGQLRGLRKTHGLQGPIDDAFLDSFLCVRPTGTPWHAEPNAAAIERLDRFGREFAKWMRGDVRVKDDRSVTEAEIASNNLILFGDPSSNALIRKIAGRLPIRWSKETIAINGSTYDAATHLPVLIFPNPLNPKRYVVLNTGHTFGEREFRGTNALLFPRLGDYGVLHIGPSGVETVTAGLFDENWRLRP
jgi:pimeloyl-ACP methyl ester carboxylesterase